MVKFKDERPYADVAAAEKKLLELANAMEADKGTLASTQDRWDGKDWLHKVKCQN
jgi:hypothetical protein